MQGRVIGRCSLHPLEDAEACNAWKRATDILGCVGEASLVVGCLLVDEDHQISCGQVLLGSSLIVIGEFG